MLLERIGRSPRTTTDDIEIGLTDATGRGDLGNRSVRVLRNIGFCLFYDAAIPTAALCNLRRNAVKYSIEETDRMIRDRPARLDTNREEEGDQLLIGIENLRCVFEFFPRTDIKKAKDDRIDVFPTLK